MKNKVFKAGQKVRDFYGVVSYVIEQRENTLITTNGLYHVTKVF